MNIDGKGLELNQNSTVGQGNQNQYSNNADCSVKSLSNNDPNIVNLGMLDEIISVQKRYFDMYINNKSAAVAIKLESDIKNILTNSIETEINNLINTQITKLATNIKDTIKETVEVKLKDEIIKLENNQSELLKSEIDKLENQKNQLLKDELNKLQLIMYEDMSEYFDKVIDNKIKNHCKFEDCLDTNINKNTNDTNDVDSHHKQSSIITDVIIDDSCRSSNEKNLIDEICNTLKEIEEIKTSTAMIEQDRIINELKISMIQNINKDQMEPELGNLINVTKVKNFGHSVSEGLAFNFRVNKYCTLLLTTMLGIFFVSQMI
jgi:hypothetical protein